ncbi:hypothetical protein BDA96_04G208000 [Sorghum bicolor]|uniref:Uncharacterized protein n=2 Tax=Sorghum bicolor TaxID=4558 RepID=A0A921R6G5_SORBI|nr:hypothetical protein BDA96_04G208000 [Sorghum bicolor]OQU85222.1 hypothetical protein SORBI_3004G195650 [Sorghum bicolor]
MHFSILQLLDQASHQFQEGKSMHGPILSRALDADTPAVHQDQMSNESSSEVMELLGPIHLSSTAQRSGPSGTPQYTTFFF